MAATQAQMRGLFTRLGAPAPAATAIVQRHGITNLQELGLHFDKDMESLVKALRRPGGTINNPNRGRGAAADAQPATIPNPGFEISHAVEMHLKLASYYVRHQDRTSRTCVPEDIQLASVRALRLLHDTEQAHEDPTEVPPLGTNWQKNVEKIQEWFRGYLGCTGVPLAYVIRESHAIPEGPDPKDNYPTVEDEMIMRAPHRDAEGHFTEEYKKDRDKVWVMMVQLCREHVCWVFIKKAQRARDGHAAYWMLYNNYLGPNNTGNMASQAEDKLRSLTYQGEKKRFNFEKFIRLQTENFQVLNDLKKYGHAGVDEASKVRQLVKSIKTTALDPVKTRIISEDKLKEDYEKSVSLCKDYILLSKPSGTNPTIQVAATGTSPNSSFNDINRDDPLDRYYTKKEYNMLSNKGKLALKRKREARGHKPGDGTPQANKKTRFTKGQRRQIAAIAQGCVEKIQDNETEDDDDDNDDKDDNKNKGNKNHPALNRPMTRQQQKKNKN